MEDKSYQVVDKRRSGRNPQSDADNKGYFVPKYNQRNSSGRYNGNNNRQRNQMNRQNSEGRDLSWRHSDNGYNRHPQNRGSTNGLYRQYSNRNGQENKVACQDLITDPPAKKVVEEYRQRLIANCSDEDCEPTVVNDRLVYSRKCIMKLAETLVNLPPCHLSYKIYKRRLVNAVESDEELDENCWDMPTTDEFNLDNSLGDIEATRQQFLERNLQESRQAVEREHAEVDEAVAKLKEMELNGSIFSMLDEADAKSPVALSPFEPLSPVTDEGIDGIVEPEDLASEVAVAPDAAFTEADLLRTLSSQRAAQPAAPLAAQRAQSVAQSASQPAAQPVAQSFSQPLGQSMSQPMSQSMGQPMGQPMSQSMGQPMGQPMSQSMGQPMGQSLGQPLGQSLGQPKPVFERGQDPYAQKPVQRLVQPLDPRGGRDDFGYSVNWGDASDPLGRYMGGEMLPPYRGMNRGYPPAYDPRDRVYQSSPLRYSQYDREMAVPGMYRGDLGYRQELRAPELRGPELRGQQGDVGYIPNRYFNRMNRGNPPDLMQMFDSQDRIAQMHEGYGYPPRVNPMMRMEQPGQQPGQPERQMSNPYWMNGNVNRDYLMRQNAHVRGNQSRYGGVNH